MRILHVLDHSLPLHSGYTFRTRAILKAQIAHGWQVAGVTGPRHGAFDASEEQVDGLAFHRTAVPPPAPTPIGEWREIGALARRIEQVAAVFRPDVLHAHSPVLNALATLKAARRLRLPVLYEIRAFWEDAAVGNGTGREGSARYRLTRAAETMAVRRADAVAVICEGLRGDLIARGIEADKIMVSPNGVDLTLFGEPSPRDDALAAALGLGGEVVGYVGSFYDYEGLDGLIAAMPMLLAERPDARLLMVGGGPMADALAAQAKASPVADRIRLLQPDRYPGLSAQDDAADRSGDAAETAGSDGAAAAGGGVERRRAPRTDRGWRDGHAVRARRSGGAGQGAGGDAGGSRRVGAAARRRARVRQARA
jgi:glycogen synthase